MNLQTNVDSRAQVIQQDLLVIIAHQSRLNVNSALYKSWRTVGHDILINTNSKSTSSELFHNGRSTFTHN